jgi:superfamily II DNA/RNA helicase
MEQPERIKELDRFKAGEINILVASDVAARGLDIKGVSHVFNFDVPWQPDDYIHRIGRTGRAGATGTSVTLVTKEDAEAVASIEKLIGSKIPEVEGSAEPPREEAVESKPARRSRAKKAPEPKTQAEAEPEPETRKQRPAPREPGRRERPQPEPDRREPVAAMADDDGWNGPVPSFLGQGFGT